MSKENENQRHLVYQDDTYIILRPLTFEASKKYGSNTKWCTTMEHEPSYFDKFYSRGILIYILNKVNGVKIASYRSVHDGTHEFSFWNQIDHRIDSMETNLPQFVLDIVKNEIKQNFKSNRELLSEEDIVKFEKQMVHHEMNKMVREDFFNETEPVPLDPVPLLTGVRSTIQDDLNDLMSDWGRISQGQAGQEMVYQNENTRVSFNDEGDIDVIYRPNVPKIKVC
jgi:hypothetical protein